MNLIPLTGCPLLTLALFAVVGPAACLLAQPNAPDAPVTQATATSEDEAKYTEAIARRARGIVAALQLKDPAQADRAQQILVAHYRALRAWGETHGTTLPAQPLHDEFLARLASAGLGPEQIDLVKDEMTYRLVDVTYDAYCDMLLDLTSDQKAQIRAWLIDARELAMDAGSSKEKHGVFGKTKGRINNYLAKEGYDLKQATKDWQARLRARREAAASQPSDSSAPAGR